MGSTRNADGLEELVLTAGEYVRQAGREYAASGTISPETMKKLSVPMIPDAVYAKVCNGEQ